MRSRPVAFNKPDQGGFMKFLGNILAIGFVFLIIATIALIAVIPEMITVDENIEYEPPDYTLLIVIVISGWGFYIPLLVINHLIIKVRNTNIT